MGTAQWNFNARDSWVAEVSGCKMLDQRQNFSGDIMMYMTGPRRTDREGRWMPFGQILFGDKRITIDEVLPDKKAWLEAANAGRPLGYEFHSQWTKTNQANGFALSIGGGLDYSVSRSATIRVASVENSHAWLPQPEVASYPTSVRLAMGFTLKMGNW